MTVHRRIAGTSVLRLGWLAGIGLTLAAFGWTVLVLDTVLADIVVLPIRRPLAPLPSLAASASAFHADLRVLAEIGIASGFALAIIGVLRVGFGALDRFFETVLMRTDRADIAAPEMSTEREPMIGRPYRSMPDGSVEVDTLVGTRRFATMAQARDFI